MASSTNSTPPSDLSDPKRYITDTNPDGMAVFSQAVDPHSPSALTRLGYITPRPPADPNGGADVKTYLTSLQSSSDLPPLVPAGGGVETRLLRPGDLAVQRSTMHARLARPECDRVGAHVGRHGGEPAQPVVVGGETLGTSFPKD
ncbi:hypothetical protein VMCG_06273 [Cytospora schulzeri]|uniref:Uncharacterized protein n=1 Tax=Cytospora schulzeri TaxID=448051 RepID=A0A423W9I3_9PEZI|nr:hypothetical protein VMCG_06273 [Valsa malicola]